MARSVEERVGDDLNQVMTILNPLGSFPQPKKVFRLGSSKPNVVRPLKIVYDNKDEAMSILTSNKSNTNRKFHFRADLTKLQRETNAAVIQEFNDRKSRGENEIVLTYRDNLAQIMHKTTNRRPKN
ncbi:hypothetical protein Zmor_026129 [Zophobas morio]|uniref:Uncharacterized protein n=1 Tax=Zophobas morio TaxID=2755281 RepID=A0AA38M5Q7_9CUCU|nr:hypothetical protein Zmor_026129 [Zophobas morio]